MTVEVLGFEMRVLISDESKCWIAASCSNSGSMPATLEAEEAEKQEQEGIMYLRKSFMLLRGFERRGGDWSY